MNVVAAIIIQNKVKCLVLVVIFFCLGFAFNGSGTFKKVPEGFSKSEILSEVKKSF